MKNKKKYDLGSLVVVDKADLFKQSFNVHSSDANEADLHEQYPFDENANFTDISQYRRVAMAGPFGT